MSTTLHKQAKRVKPFWWRRLRDRIEVATEIRKFNKEQKREKKRIDAINNYNELEDHW